MSHVKPKRKYISAYLQDSSGWEHQGSTLPIRGCTIIYVIRQGPSCHKKEHGNDCGIRCLPEQCHLVISQLTLHARRLYGQHMCAK